MVLIDRRSALKNQSVLGAHLHLHIDDVQGKFGVETWGLLGSDVTLHCAYRSPAEFQEYPLH